MSTLPWVTHLHNLWINRFFTVTQSSKTQGCIVPAVNFLSVGVVSHQQVIKDHSGKHVSSGERSALKCQSIHILKASIKIIFKSIVKGIKFSCCWELHVSSLAMSLSNRVTFKTPGLHFSVEPPLIVMNWNHFCNRTVKSYTFTLCCSLKREVFKQNINQVLIPRYMLYSIYSRGMLSSPQKKNKKSTNMWPNCNQFYFLTAPNLSLSTEK